MRRAGALIILLTAAPALVHAQDSSRSKPENSITIYGGERFGGSLTDATSGSSVDLQNGSSLAAAVDIGLDHGTQLEFFYSRQNTSPDGCGSSPMTSSVRNGARSFAGVGDGVRPSSKL